MRDIVINFKDGTQAITDSWGTAHNYYNSIKKEILTIFIGDDLVFSVVDKIDTFLHYTPPVVRMNSKVGIKEKTGKLHYELSWEFIEEMAKRMANNKSDKYPIYNWKKPIDVQDIKDAINRHHIEVMKGNYKDEEESLGHIVAYACGSMMLWWQLKFNNNNGS